MSGDIKDRVAHSVRQRLLNLSRERGEDYNLLLTRYAIERFLYRLSLSAHRANLILKGALLFQLWAREMHRATRDMDLLAVESAKAVDIETKLNAICSTPVEEDGLTFNLTELRLVDIREDNRYGGIRARFPARLGSAKITMQIDFGFGDAVTPPPIETDYPTLLDMAAPRILAYPRETVVAEKLEAIVDLGLDNSRMKDYFDLWFIVVTFQDDATSLTLAVKHTFARRRQPLPEATPVGLSDTFAQDELKRAQWSAFLDRAIGASLSLDEVVTTVRAFAMPLFAAALETD